MNRLIMAALAAISLDFATATPATAQNLEAPVAGEWYLLRGPNFGSTHVCPRGSASLPATPTGSPYCETAAYDFVPIGRSNRIGGVVLAASSGRVVYAGDQTGFGKSIIMEHGGYYTRYSHLDTINLVPDAVEKKIFVKYGTMIGKSGATGTSVGPIPHLHFAVYRKTGEHTLAAADYNAITIGGLRIRPESQAYVINGSPGAPKLRATQGRMNCSANCGNIN